MSLHSYSICLTHLVFSTLNKEPILQKEQRILLSEYFKRYSKEKNIYQRINFVNPEHVHMLIDLPVSLSVDKAAQLFKGSSSYWLNKEKLFKEKFSWARGYGVFFVSSYNAERVSRYIANQEEHHRKVSFDEEYEGFGQMIKKIKDSNHNNLNTLKLIKE